MTPIHLNDPVLDVALSATHNQTLKLSDFVGQKLVLYFYPKDNTPGCTDEGRAFAAHFPDFQQHNATILGVSRDSTKTHEGFKLKHHFPFDLLSDADGQLCQAFEVIKLKSMFGKQVQGIERSTFLFDEHGALRHEWRKVKVKDHVDAVLAAVIELSNSQGI